MSRPGPVETKLVLTVASFAVAALVFTGLWGEVAEPAIRRVLEGKVGASISTLPTPVIVAYAFFVVVLPWIALMAGTVVLFYRRSFLPARGPLAREQLSKLQEARVTLQNALTLIAAFEHDLEARTSEAEGLGVELNSLKNYNAQTVSEIQTKLRAVDIARRGRRWAELMVAFFIGVGSSLVGSYLWELFKPTI